MNLLLAEPGRFRTVFFDLVGTLIRARVGIGEQYAACARRHGAAAADPERLGRAFGLAMRQARPMAFPGRSLQEASAEERRWWHDLVRRVVVEAGIGDALGRTEQFDRFFDDLFDHFTTGDAWALYDDVQPALRRLHGAGLRVGLITNYDTRVRAVLDSVGLSPLIDSVTIPAMVGAAKPDAAIFQHALRQEGLAGDEAIYVGDEIEDDYAGAEGAGMVAVLLDREGRCEGQHLRRIRSLADLSL